ncbi:glycoside hydrolase family 35 protein [Pontibacillus salipaludis]|uniref:Glycosyl hydrolase n=1 Tax=Pontibacillus salipaludis TaxID=1697394 RepID=A0ABQ1Q500_9BACI|nr:beta-galactosidase [Pontibacillus salipaludis]GGD12967.1 glycosyl hydrolase [Pontibacillus salipaludis]
MLTVKENQFYLNGEPYQILSGAIHYFRVVPEYWEDRLRKLKAMGLNTVETYIPWNVHEPHKGEFYFDGLADLEGFIQKAQELGLHVIARPAPYICAEWEFGGLPAWLLKEHDLELRCAEPKFLNHLKEYYEVLLPKLVPYLQSNGGPIIAVQIENEYGAYGNDQEYLQYNKQLLEEYGIDVLLFTSDGPDMIEHGSLPDVVTTLNFGSRPQQAFEMLEQFKPNSPKMCTEFWIGWFDYWGGKHHTREAKDANDVFQEMLDQNVSINFYMFHGGTNFGFMNGANHYEKYTPTITSYDYDALLTEWGEPTEKYWFAKASLEKKSGVVRETPDSMPKKAYGEVALNERVSLFDIKDKIAQPVSNKTPLSMEKLDQNYGYTLYSTLVNDQGTFELDHTPIKDRAFIYVNGVYQMTVSQNDEERIVNVHFPDEENRLEILVENMGRVNYGKHLKDRKGIIDNLWLNNQYWFDWEMHSFPLEDVDLPFRVQQDMRYPMFYKGCIEVDEVADTFVDLEGWTKGNVFVNGFNLGRYWQTEGPQQRLYVPGPLLREGSNEIMVLELEGNRTSTLSFVDTPYLG